MTGYVALLHTRTRTRWTLELHDPDGLAVGNRYLIDGEEWELTKIFTRRTEG
jgi:hypothetical protein